MSFFHDYISPLLCSFFSVIVIAIVRKLGVKKSSPNTLFVWEREGDKDCVGVSVWYGRGWGIKVKQKMSEPI